MKSEEKSSLGVVTVVTAVLWTLFMTGVCLWGITREKEQTRKLLAFQARGFFQEVVTTRSWNASHGGVYVPVTSRTQPNPYLKGEERDVVTQSGVKLTRINPAYMTRQIGEIARSKTGVWFHITSENPIRPANAPDSWEAKALKGFASGEPEALGLLEEGEGVHFRYMAPLWVEDSCLKCHGGQGYRKGDLRGGISVTVSAAPVLAFEKDIIQKSVFTFFCIWSVGLSGICLVYGRLRCEEAKRRTVIAELQDSLSKVKTLKGLIPICANCKKIKNDKGYWDQLEDYIRKHSDAEFSHSICRECTKKLYPDLDLPE